MASNEITARAILQGDIKANVTLGVPVNVYVDREIYDGETEITPTEEDITLETAGKAVLDDILVHGVDHMLPNATFKKGKYIPEETYAELGNRNIVSINELGFTPSRFILMVSDISTINTMTYTVIKASYESTADNEWHLKMTLRYIGTVGSMTTNLKDTPIETVNSGYINIADGYVCYRTQQGFALPGGVEYTWYAWCETDEPTEYTVEGTFKPTETGVITMDTGYDGEGYPKMILFHQTGDLDDSNLEDFANQSFMSIAALKCYPQNPEYAETTNLDSYMLSLAYKYGAGTATRFTQSTGYVLSQDDPTYKISNAIRMPDSRTLKIWAGDSYTGEGGYFMVGVEYKYRIIYTKPMKKKPLEDVGVIEGEFQTDTAGILTIDLPYSGESYAKAIMIYDADGIHKADIPRAYTMTAYCAYKNNAQEPTYDGDTANNGYRYQVVYTGTVTYTSTAGSPAYVCTQADPVLGVTNAVKMPDNHTLKVYVSNATAGSSVRFRVGIKYKYQVIY